MRRFVGRSVILVFMRLGLLLLVACGSTGSGGDDGPPPGGTQTVPEIRCTGVPDAGPSRSWRHTTSDFIVASGSPHHRGIDLIATTDAATQMLSGKITYGPTDKDLEDEDIDVFACEASQWTKVGTARTNDNGIFNLPLAGAARLDVGMRDMYLSIAGDRTGAAFLAFVAPPGTGIVVSDIDGTLTASETAYPESLATGGDVAVQPGAPAALAAIVEHGYSIIYLSTRGDRFTQDSRDWLAAKQLPRGPLRLPPSIITQPGDDTVVAKTGLLQTLAGLSLKAGIGNRTTDVAAYTNGGLPVARIFVNLPEFADELAADIANQRATFFDPYDDLRTQYVPGL